MFGDLFAPSLEQANLFIIELHRLLPMGFLEAQTSGRAWKAGRTLSYATQIACTDVGCFADTSLVQTTAGTGLDCGESYRGWPGSISERPGWDVPLQPGSLSSKPSADQLAGFAYVIEIFGEL